MMAVPDMFPKFTVKIFVSERKICELCKHFETPCLSVSAYMH